MVGFESFDDFVSLDRITELALSVDGARLVATIGSLAVDGRRFTDALWELDPAGTRPASRLTRSRPGSGSGTGERGPVFCHDGSLLFRADRSQDGEDPAVLWQLPPVGEARPVVVRPGGVAGVVAARGAETIVVSVPVLAASRDVVADSRRRAARKDLEVSAILHRASPVRFWGRDLGPDELRLYRAARLPESAAPDWAATGRHRRYEDGLFELTGAPGRALDEASFVLTTDGSTLVTSWNVPAEPGLARAQLAAIDTTTGARRVLADEPDFTFTDPAVSPDGRWAVCVRTGAGGYDEIPSVTLLLVDLSYGAGRVLVTDPDLWPGEPAFSADGASVFFLADQVGHRAVFRLDIGSGEISRLTASGHFAQLQVAPDGRTLYALRDAIDSPPRPVRLDAHEPDGRWVELPAPGSTSAPGAVEEIVARVEDGTLVHARLLVPDTATSWSPAPLLVWMHGGPLSSWNGWSWRWNPWLMVAKGYAVVLPDPALSTGYGAQMIRRGWGQWGGAPYTDVMAITDVVAARPEIDGARAAAMGGSFGGYLANWVAGHTGRFRCIVTHAGLWALDQFAGTTDEPGYWVKEWGLLAKQPERYTQWSPHHFVDAISSPMLVIHGDKDYRVPIGEALRLWWDLQREGVESSFLYFPDEGHWILKPGNARIWYDTVWAWLAQHLHGADWQQPQLL